MSTSSGRTYSPKLLACGSLRVEAATAPSSRPWTMKFEAERIGKCVPFYQQVGRVPSIFALTIGLILRTREAAHGPQGSRSEAAAWSECTLGRDGSGGSALWHSSSCRSWSSRAPQAPAVALVKTRAGASRYVLKG